MYSLEKGLLLSLHLILFLYLFYNFSDVNALIF